uniref:B30.2/SPRY domain-containing protein n=2 Tax=Esox lucius TaxID=8010 RepID=A0AAY5L0L1_ESOLU
MKIAKDKQMVYIQAIKRSFQTEKYIEMQAKRTVYHIEHHFGELYIFIDEEKKKSVGAINMEMISNIKMLKDKSEELSTTITCLSNKIRVVEEGLESDHVAFLQRYQAIRKLSRTHCTVPDPQLVSGALIDVVKHLGNLEFSVTQKLHQSRSYYPVILDPNTAHRDICVDKTLTEITMNDSDYSEDIDKHPGSPERFNLHPWILASEGFDSGINSWTVKIEIFKGCCSWAIGLLEGSVSRHGVIDKGVWSLVYDEDVYTAHSGSKEPVTLTLEKDLLTVRVALDWDQGLLSFFDVDNDLHIHTFKHIFRNKVYPFFSKKCDEHTLTILNGVS